MMINNIKTKMGWAGLGRVATPVGMLYSERHFYYMALCRILKISWAHLTNIFIQNTSFLAYPL